MKIQALIATAAIAGTLGLGMAAPAKADGAASTRNIILGAAAIFAGFAIESNVAHKQQLANAVEGYTPNGSTVYADGHVVLPDGQVYYPGNYGQQIACNGQDCQITGGNGPAFNGAYNGNGYYNGNAYNGNNYNGGWNGTDGYARGQRNR